MLENGLSIDLTEIEQFIRGQGLGESVSFQNLVEQAEGRRSDGAV